MTPRVELLEAVVDVYEDAIRRCSDLQRTLAQALPLEPVRWLLQGTADLTRDVGAVQVSGVRWLLES